MRQGKKAGDGGVKEMKRGAVNGKVISMVDINPTI